MDEPLCFVHFINASTCSHKESGGCCSGKGATEMPGGCSALPTFIPWEGQWEVNGVEPLGSQGSDPLTVKRKKYLPWAEETEQDIFWEGTATQGNLCCKAGTCLNDFLNQGLDPKIGSDR